MPLLHLAYRLLNLGSANVLPPEDSRGSHVASLSRVDRHHHVPGIEHTADQLVSGKVLPHWVVAASQRGIAIDEEVEPWEGYQVDALLSHVSVELPRKAEGAGDS